MAQNEFAMLLSIWGQLLMDIQNNENHSILPVKKEGCHLQWFKNFETKKKFGGWLNNIFYLNKHFRIFMVLIVILNIHTIYTSL